MKKKQPTTPPSTDTPLSRKRRLQRRLQEISDKGEQELAGVIKSIENIKSTFKSNK